MDENSVNYSPSDRLLLRVPSLPIEYYSAKSHEVSSDITTLDRIFQEAVLATSPTLAWSTQVRTKEGVDFALDKFKLRMTTRSTPFSALGGVADVEFSERIHQSSLTINTPQNRISKARIDLSYLFKQVELIENDKSIRKNLYLVKNPSNFLKGERLFVTERSHTKEIDSDNDVELVTVRYVPAVAKTLEFCCSPVQWLNLEEAIAKESPEVDRDTISHFINTLFENDILISTLRPPLTVQKPLQWLLDRLDEASIRNDIYTHLSQLNKKIDSFNQKTAGCGFDVLSDILEFTQYESGSRQKNVQIDLPVEVSAGSLQRVEPLISDMKLAAQLILRTTLARVGNLTLNNYAAEFQKRFSDEEVPILELLDEDIGLGIPKGYKAFESTVGPQTDNDIPPQRTELLLKILLETSRKKERSYHLSDDEIEKLTIEGWQEAAPKSIDLFFSLATTDISKLADSDFLFVITPRVAEAPAGRSLGRFAHVLPRIEKWLHEQAVLDVQEEESIVADLIYNHKSSRVNNVAIRPQLYTNQIYVNGAAYSSECPEKIISLDEIQVGLSKQRFYLRHKSSGKQIIARSTHLLSFQNAPHVCRFMHEVSQYNAPIAIPFDWGVMNQSPFLPRLQIERIVLSLARWLVPKSLATEKRNCYAAIQRWREQWNVPQQVYLTENVDNFLLLDLEDSQDIAILIKSLEKHTNSSSNVFVTEGIPGKEHSWIKDECGGKYLSEFVVPLRSTNINSKVDILAQSTRNSTLDTQIKRAPENFQRKLPGSDWLFLKVYTGSTLQNDVLRKIEGKLRESGLLDERLSWFFMRYEDPEKHLRIRIRGEPKYLVNSVLPSLHIICEDLVTKKHIYRIAFDTYEREVARYGGMNAMQLCERVFELDSAFFLQLLKIGEVKAFEKVSTARIALSTDYLLRGLGYDQKRRSSLYSRIRELSGEGFKRRDNMLTQRFRKERGTYWEIFSNHSSQLKQALEEFREALLPIGENLKELEARKLLTTTHDGIAHSLVHMHCNRAGLNRPEEYAEMYTLERLFDGFHHHVPEEISLL